MTVRTMMSPTRKVRKLTGLISRSAVVSPKVWARQPTTVVSYINLLPTRKKQLWWEVKKKTQIKTQGQRSGPSQTSLKRSAPGENFTTVWWCPILKTQNSFSCKDGHLRMQLKRSECPRNLSTIISFNLDSERNMASTLNQTEMRRLAFSVVLSKVKS